MKPIWIYELWDFAKHSNIYRLQTLQSENISQITHRTLSLTKLFTNNLKVTLIQD